MNRFAVVLFLSPLSITTAAACDEKVLPELADRYMAAALSPDCESRLRVLGAPGGWIDACNRALSEPNPEEKKEFARRTSFHYTRLVEVDGSWLAEGTLRQPDPYVFQAEIDRRFGCGFGSGGWTDYRPPDHTCEPIDWSAIPIVETRAGVVFRCAENAWRVQDLE
jgi:hypothetical protein